MENICGTKEGLHRVYTAPQPLKSVYTGRDKATVENHLKFVSMRHKYNTAAVYCRDLSCRATSSLDSISDDEYFVAPLIVLREGKK